MSRKRAKITYKLPYWCSGAADCSEKIFIQIGASLMQHPAFTGLKDSARWTYIAMVLEAKGRPDFNFPGGRQSFTAFPKGHCGETSKNLKPPGLLTSLQVDGTPNRQRITAFLFVGKLHRKTLMYGLHIRMCATLALPQMRYFLTGYAKMALPHKRKAPF